VSFYRHDNNSESVHTYYRITTIKRQQAS